MKKLLLSTLFSTAFFVGMSQSIFVNEVHYDNASTDVDEGIEIAGPAGTDLAGYSIELYNGGTSTVYGTTLALSGIIPVQDNGYGTINFPITGLQNGSPDGFALIDDGGIVIQFLSYEGVITATAGTAIGLTSTDIGVSESAAPLGESLQLVGVGTVYTDFTWTTQGHTRDLVNTGQSFGGSLPPTVSFDVVSVSISEAIGTVTVNINITNEDINPTSADVVLGTSTATGGGVDFTYTTPTTVTFPASSTTQQTVTVTIVDDASTETLETIVLELQNVTNNGVVGNNTSHTISITDNDAPVISACSELFFSEYMEGTSFNKALEIYNPTAQTIDISDYEVRLYGNGSTTATATLNPTGIVVPGDVFVIANGQAQANILLEADATSTVANFNGDDAVELYKISTGTVVDVIGEVGTDPGTEWAVGTGSTVNNVLVRMASIDAGTPAWTGVGDLQWDVYTTADTLFIGNHTNTGCVAAIPLTAYPIVSTDTTCIGDTLYFTNSTFGGTGVYTYNWAFGDGNNSIMENPSHVYTSSGLYTVSLDVLDDGGAIDDSVFTVFVNTPSVNFSFTGEPAVIFTDLTTGIGNTYLWDFGDGNTSTLSDPTNNYSDNGSYTVCLTVTTPEGCSDSTCQPLQITGTGVDAFDLNTITIFPNPTSTNQVTIANQNNEVLSIIISNVIGQTVWGGTISKTETFNLPKIQKGNYFVRITSEKGTITKKLMVK